jgi:hypothetical protein
MKTGILLLSCLMLHSLYADQKEIAAIDSISNPTLAYSDSSSSGGKRSGKSVLAKYDGILYGGGALGYGRIAPGSNDSVISSGLLDPLITVIQNVKSDQGGASWRLFMGALVNVTSVVSIGTELGFTYFPETKGSIRPDLSGIVDGVNFRGSASAKGYGIDLLYNATFYLIPELYFAFKPGIQFAYQKNMVRLDADLGDLITSSDLRFNVKNKFVNTALLPEVILATGWIFRNSVWGDWDFNDYPLAIEFYYQHVFGNDDAAVTKRVSSRDAFGGSVGLRF